MKNHFSNGFSFIFKKGEIGLKTFCETEKKLENRLLNQEKNCQFINADAKTLFERVITLLFFKVL